MLEVGTRTPPLTGLQQEEGFPKALVQRKSVPFARLVGGGLIFSDPPLPFGFLPSQLGSATLTPTPPQGRGAVTVQEAGAATWGTVPGEEVLVALRALATLQAQV